MRTRLGLLAWFCLLGLVSATAVAWAQDAPIVVGRVSHVEGELLRYIPDEKDWVAVVKDAPFGSEDTLYTGNSGRSELIVPNGTWVRAGFNTQIEFLALEEDMSEADVASGIARFYNKSSNGVIKVTCPFGYVLANPGTVFDIYVGDNSLEVLSIQGKVTFVHAAGEARYDISAGEPSILADNRQVSSGDGDVDPDWHRWNLGREDLWARRARSQRASVEYLPPALQTEGYVLEENGRWERVFYEGGERWFWRPVTVSPGWAPYTVGRWTEWYGDQTWIPGEPFGYLTHHYGNWVYVGNAWYWAPPVATVRVGVPLLDVGFHWYPGRVSWIHTDAHIGWVPLAPHETFYSHHHWGGPRAVVVTGATFGNIHLHVGNYAYLNHAVVVSQNHLYSVNTYSSVRVTNINHATIVNYRAAPIVNHTVINNYTVIKNRYHYSDVVVREKPHISVVNRIEHNRTVIREGRHERGSVISERVGRMHEGRVNRETRVDRPRATNALVPASEMHRPRSDVKLPQREIRSRGDSPERIRPESGRGETGRGRDSSGPDRVRSPRGAGRDPGAGPGDRPSTGEKPEPRRERAGTPDGSGPPAAGPERVRSPRGERTETPGRGDRPEAPGQVGKPERGRSPAGGPEPSGHTGEAPDRVRSPRSERPDRSNQPAVQPEPQGGSPERAKPQRQREQQGGGQGGPGSQSGQPGAGSERVKPQRSQDQQGGPQGGSPERAKPERQREQQGGGQGGPGSQSGQPGAGSERVKPQRSQDQQGGAQGGHAQDKQDKPAKEKPAKREGKKGDPDQPK
jgi:hypothetical protein